MGGGVLFHRNLVRRKVGWKGGSKLGVRVRGGGLSVEGKVRERRERETSRKI